MLSRQDDHLINAVRIATLSGTFGSGTYSNLPNRPGRNIASSISSSLREGVRLQ